MSSELEQRIRNILEALVTSEKSTGHPKHREFIAFQIGITADEVEIAAKNILRNGEAKDDAERALVRLIMENRYNRHLAR